MDDFFFWTLKMRKAVKTNMCNIHVRASVLHVLSAMGLWHYQLQRVICMVNGTIDIFVSSSCKLLAELHFPPWCLLHCKSRYAITLPWMFGYSEWMKFIRHFLKSPRTSGCIVVSEIASHTNGATGSLHCSLHNIQELGVFFFREERKDGEKAAWFIQWAQAWRQPSLRASWFVCFLRVYKQQGWPGSACRIYKDLGWCRW